MEDVKRNINYLHRDFSGIKEQLLEFAQNYFPESYADFSDTSPGMMFMEMAAYVGDVLSFYQDIQVQETFLQYAKNPSNLYAMAYMMGYRPRVTSVAEVELTVQQKIEAIQDSNGKYTPNWDKAVQVLQYSEINCASSAGSSYLLRDTVDFSVSSSYDPTTVEIVTIAEDGTPREYLLTKKARAFSGKIKTLTRTVGSYQKYLTFDIKDNNIVGIIDIKEQENEEHEWKEVPFLGQDTIFEEEANQVDFGEKQTPYVLKVKKVPRRFVTRFVSKDTLQVQFGAGMFISDVDTENFLPNPITLQPNTQELVDKYDVAYDPSNFLFSKSYGLVPTDCTLNVRYIVGGGIHSNVPANSLTEIGTVYVKNRTGEIVETPELYFNNEKPATGGRDGDTVVELRQNALRSFAEQRRVVTLSDFNVRALSMPAKFGTVSKVLAVNEPLSNVSISSLTRNPLAVTLYVLSQNEYGQLTYASEQVKGNLRTYLTDYLMITDAIDIKDAFIINVGINYDVVLRPGAVLRNVLLDCNRVIQDYFRVDKLAINEPINLSTLYTLLDRIKGVQTVKKIEVLNLVGEDKGYSQYGYDIAAATKENVVYPSYDPCIFEVKYPDRDILGRAVSV